MPRVFGCGTTVGSSGKASWALAGVHNVENALAALAAVSAAGVMAEAALGHLPISAGAPAA